MKWIKRFNENINNKIILNDYIILNLLEKREGTLRDILRLISKKIKNGYIVIYHDDCKSTYPRNIIDDLKSLGFDVKIYDDDNYDVDFLPISSPIRNRQKKVRISWEYEF